MLDTAKANELIAAVNAFLNLRVQPSEAGKLMVAGSTAILDLTPQDPAAADLPAIPFNLVGVGGEAAKFGVVPGNVNDMMPTLGGIALDAIEPPRSAVSAGTHLVYLVCNVDIEPTSSTFGDLLSAEIQTSIAAIESTFENPALRLGSLFVELVDDVYTVSVTSEVFGSLKLVRFFADYVFIPYYVIAS